MEKVIFRLALVLALTTLAATEDSTSPGSLLAEPLLGSATQDSADKDKTKDALIDKLTSALSALTGKKEAPSAIEGDKSTSADADAKKESKSDRNKLTESPKEDDRTKVEETRNVEEAKKTEEPRKQDKASSGDIADKSGSLKDEKTTKQKPNFFRTMESKDKPVVESHEAVPKIEAPEVKQTPRVPETSLKNAVADDLKQQVEEIKKIGEEMRVLMQRNAAKPDKDDKPQDYEKHADERRQQPPKTADKPEDQHRPLQAHKASKVDIAKLGESFAVTSAHTVFKASHISPNKIYNLKLTGFNVVTVEVDDGNGNKYALHDVPLSGQEGGCQVPITSELLRDTFHLIIYTKHDNLLDCEATIEVVDYLQMDFNSNHFVVTAFVHTLHYRVRNPQKFAKKDKENRIQFIMQTSLDTQKLAGIEKVEMFINKAPMFPTETNHELKASGSLGYGLIKSLSSKNQYYCMSDDCDYYVTIVVVGVDHIYFFPTIFANESEIPFNSYLFLIEEVEADEIVTYKLKVPKTTENWLFTVNPTEGNPDFYINPDVKPANLAGYKYRAVGKGPENLLITHQESQSFEFTHEVFYVSYKSAVPGQAVTFRFEVTKTNDDKRIYLKEDHMYSGVAAVNEVVNYYLDLANAEGSTFAVNVDLVSLSGNSDLYIKECVVGDANCAVTENDVLSARNNSLGPEYAGLIFRYSAREANEADHKTDQILLNVNCHGKNGDAGFQPNKTYETSASCRFAVGVHCRDANNRFGTLYRLVTYGNNSITEVRPFESTSVRVMASEKLNFEVSLSYFLSQHNSYAVFRVYSLTGSFNVYLSRTSKSPNENDFEAMLNVRAKDANTLATHEYIAYMELQTELPTQHLYFTVEGLEYSVLDVYIDLVKDINEATSLNERLRINKMVHRGIGEDKHVIYNDRKVFYESFFLEMPFDTNMNKDLDISLDGDMVGLELCVQRDFVYFEPEKECDYHSSSGNLTITGDENSATNERLMSVTVFKYAEKEPRPYFFPINFRLLVTIDNVTKDGAELVTIGKSHSKKLNPSDSITYNLNISRMVDHALIILTSESPMIDAVVSTSMTKKYAPLARLSYSKFAMRINDAGRFKAQHCRSSTCEVFVRVINSGLHKARFTLTYTVDDTPISITEGSHIFVPADKKQYFLTKPNIYNPLSFNVATDKTASVVYAQVYTADQLHEHRATTYLTESKFDFKTHIDTENQIVIRPDIIAERKAVAVAYLVVPKFDISSHGDDIVLYDQADKLSVSLHSTIAKLDATAQLSAHISRGDFKYYYVHIDEPKDFNIILTVHSGEADLYVNQGMYNLTTTQNYWQKSSSYKDDELLITPSMFASPSDMVGTYTIGIYAREFSQFSIRYTQSEFNVIKLQYQRMLDVQLTKNKYYYFDFYNKHAKFNSVLYAEGSDVDISVLNYDERKNQNFIDMIDNDSNYVQKFTFKKGDVPRKRGSQAVLQEQSHYIVRMKATQADARVTFSIYDAAKPLMTYMERRFTFAQDANDEQVFMIKLDSSYREVDVDVKLDFGSIEFLIDDDIFFVKEAYKLTSAGQKYVKYTVEQVSKSNDVVVFKTIFIKVKASKFSKYSIFVKPVDKFKQLKALESELVYTNKDNAQYLYYVVEKKDLHRIHSLVFEIYTVHYYAERPELLFMADADVVLNAESPFMPMPMLDYSENMSGRFIHLEIKPDIMAGFYVIKVPTSSVALPIKVSVSINDDKIIEPNGVFSGKLNANGKDMHKYTAYIPEAGEFRFLLESCADIDIHNAVFSHSSNSTDIEFETRFVQSVPYLTVNTTRKNDDVQFKTSAFNIRRGIVDGPGLVKFNVTSPNDASHNPRNADYFIISEFRPAHKEVFLYDYVDLFHTKAESKKHGISYRFMDKRYPLIVESPVPFFRDQLLVDYPDIKRVKVEFSYWLFVDDSFEAELSRCGVAAVKPHNKVHHMKTRFINREDINKQETFTYYFYPNDLDDFKREQRLTMFVSLGISFIETEEDEQHISLNNKYTSIPYFVLTIPNEKFKASHWSLILALGAGLFVLILLFMICGRRYHSPEIKIKPKDGYERGIGGANKLEMTNMDRTTIED